MNRSLFVILAEPARSLFHRLRRESFSFSGFLSDGHAAVFTLARATRRNQRRCGDYWRPRRCSSADKETGGLGFDLAAHRRFSREHSGDFHWNGGRWSRHSRLDAVVAPAAPNRVLDLGLLHVLKPDRTSLAQLTGYAEAAALSCS